jgi:hypothetical protein
MAGVDILKLVQAIASVATVIGVFLAWQQLRQVGKQARTTFEDRLNEHYRRIMEDIPADIWLGAELKALDDGQRDCCRDAIYRYIDLSNEEAFLYSKKRISRDTWIDWHKGIKANLKLPAFAEVWAEVNKKNPAGFEELRSLEEIGNL